MKRKILLSSVAITALIMTGCGGGGSASSSQTSAKVSGVADDDLILNGIVTATTPDGTVLGTTRTDSTKGSYSLSINHTGMVILNVKCDDNSTMLNTETNTTQACGKEVTLNSLADVKLGVEKPVHISPLSQLVYKNAEAKAKDGNITNVNVNNFSVARNQIGLMLGVDPISDNPTKKNAGKIIDSIHKAAEADNNISVIEFTKNLADALSDGKADNEDAVKHIVSAMSENNIANNLVDKNGTYTPPKNHAKLSDIDEAKAFFDELRTQTMSVTNSNNPKTPGFLDTESQNINKALNDKTLNIGYVGDVLNVLSNCISEAYDENKTKLQGYPMGESREFKLEKTSEGVWKYTIDENNTNWKGQISFPEVLAGDKAEDEIYKSGTKKLTVNGDVPLDYEAVTKKGIKDIQTFDGTVEVTKTSSGADISIVAKVASNGTSIELKKVKAEIAYEKGKKDKDGNVEPNLHYFKLDQLVLKGVVGDYTIDGTLNVNKYAQNDKLKAKGGIHKEYTSGFDINFECDNDTTPTVNNVVFSYNGESYTPSENSDSYYRFEGIHANINHDDILKNLDYNASCDNDGNLSIDSHNWHNSDKEVANSGWLPSDITFKGIIAKDNASLEGTINAKWLNVKTIDVDKAKNKDRFVNVKFDGKLQMPERPKMLTTLTFENNATNNVVGASYSYDKTLINLSGTFDTDMDNGNATITTQNGLRTVLKVKDGEVVTDGSTKVTKDGEKLGSLEERDGVPVIKYIDGSFESLP